MATLCQLGGNNKISHLDVTVATCILISRLKTAFFLLCYVYRNAYSAPVSPQIPYLDDRSLLPMYTLYMKVKGPRFVSMTDEANKSLSLPTPSSYRL